MAGPNAKIVASIQYKNIGVIFDPCGTVRVTLIEEQMLGNKIKKNTLMIDMHQLF